MIEKIERPIYENNIKKINEIIDKVNDLEENGGGAKFVGVNSEDTDDINVNGGGATGDNSIAIGKSAIANEDGSIAIGTNASADSEGSIAIGRYSYAESTSSGANSIAIGYGASSHGENSIAIGNGEIEVSGDYSVVIGNNAQASGDNCIVIGVGNHSTMSYDDSIAIGHANVQAKSGIALGYGNVLQNANNGIAIGGAYNENVGEDDSTYAKKESAIAIGKAAVSNGENSVAIGSNSIASTDDEFSIGNTENTRRITHVTDGEDTTDAATVNQLHQYVPITSVGNEANKIPRYDAEGHLILPDGTEVYATDDEVDVPNSSGESTHFIGINSNDSTDTNYNGGGAVGEDSIAIGKETVADGEESVAIGKNANSGNYGDIAIGNDTSATGWFSVAIGGNHEDNSPTKAEGESSVAIGHGAIVYENGTGTVSIGKYSRAYSEKAIAIGDTANVRGDCDIVIGSLAKTDYKNDNGASHSNIVIGQEAKITADGYTTENSIAIGSNALVDEGSSNSIAIGTNTKVNCSDSIAIGSGTECHGSCSIAIGDGTKVYDDYCDFSVAIGYGAEVTAENAIAIGSGAKVDYVLDGIAIGQGAQVTGGDDCVAIGNGSIANEFHEFSIGYPAQNGPYGSYGEFTRRITHVSNGINDSDAVTLGQVKAMIAALRQELRG